VGVVGEEWRRQSDAVLYGAHSSSKAPETVSGAHHRGPPSATRGVADITVRQNFQFHWVTIRIAAGSSGDALAGGLSTTGAAVTLYKYYWLPAGRV